MVTSSQLRFAHLDETPKELVYEKSTASQSEEEDIRSPAAMAGYVDAVGNGSEGFNRHQIIEHKCNEGRDREGISSRDMF